MKVKIGVGRHVNFNSGKIQIDSFDLWMGGSTFYEKLSFKMLGLSLFSYMDCGSFLVTSA